MGRSHLAPISAPSPGPFLVPPPALSPTSLTPSPAPPNPLFPFYPPTPAPAPQVNPVPSPKLSLSTYLPCIVFFSVLLVLLGWWLWTKKMSSKSHLGKSSDAKDCKLVAHASVWKVGAGKNVRIDIPPSHGKAYFYDHAKGSSSVWKSKPDGPSRWSSFWGKDSRNNGNYRRKLAEDHVHDVLAFIIHQNYETARGGKLLVSKMNSALLKLNQAREILEEVNQDDEYLFEVFRWMGIVNSELGNTKVVAAHFERAKAIAEKNFEVGHPTILSAAFTLVDVYLSLNRWDQAVQCQAEVVENLEARNINGVDSDILVEQRKKLGKLHKKRAFK